MPFRVFAARQSIWQLRDFGDYDLRARPVYEPSLPPNEDAEKDDKNLLS